jgi:hypothetical protein
MGLLDFLGGTGGTNPTGDTGGLSGLLQNKLFLQYLSGAGSALQAGKPISAGIDPVTNQAIAGQNMNKLPQSYIAMLKKALGPDESKATFSNKGINLTIPQSDLSSGAFLKEGDLFGGNLSTSSSTPTPDSTTVPKSQLDTINPFVGSQLGNVSASDLAGLTTQDIGNALSEALNVEQLRQKKVSEIADSLYKNKMMENIDSEIASRTALTESKKPIFTIPGTDIKLNREEYVKWYETANKDERTAAVKNYEYAVTKGYKGNFMSFQDANRTTNQKDYDAAVVGGYKGGFNQWLLEMKRAGATNISLDTKLTEKKAMSEVDRQNIVLKPDFHQKILEDLQKDSRGWRSTDEADKYAKEKNITFDQARSTIQRAKVRESMDMQIKQAFPKATWKKNGWYVDGKRIVRDPYALD